MERAGKAWSYRLLDDFHANTVESGTEIVHDVNLDGAESRTVIFEEDVPVDDVLIAVLYTGTSSRFSSAGAKRRNATADDYEPWFGTLVLSRRHVDGTGVMVHEIGHAIGLGNYSEDWIPSAHRYIDDGTYNLRGARDGARERRRASAVPVGRRRQSARAAPQQRRHPRLRSLRGVQLHHGVLSRSGDDVSDRA